MMTDDNRYTLFFDGACKGNPGKGGAGAVIYKNQIEIYAQSGFVGDNSTNNVSEYYGLLLGLKEAVDLKISTLNVKGDSMLIIKHMRGEYKVNSPRLKPLFVRAKVLEKQIGTVTYEHVYRENNKRADELANEGLLIMS